EQLWHHAKGNLNPNDLTDVEAVERTLNMYVEYFSQGKEELFDVDNVQAGTLWNDVMEGDMGVEEMCKKSMEELSGVLGFQEVRFMSVQEGHLPTGSAIHLEPFQMGQ
ncbi:hypothetical protein APHAL10511_007859, partial [Amanita phalloides]